MIDHITIRATDLDASTRFYRTVLATLAIEPEVENERLVRWQDFILAAQTPERPPTRNLHTAFVAPSRALVDAFWQAGIDAGYTDDGAPGERPHYRTDYYGAFLRDPDGNSVEAVHHGNTRRGGHIDHLWIRVADLAAAEAFHATIARHTGLRTGRRTEQLAQFQGAWATFTLADDGQPVTENLHLAFPAPDRQTVHEFHDAAVAAGYESNGGPGERPRYHPGYYAAFVLDPDGNNIESVVHGRGPLQPAI
jgi:catechol 2,3-dioxygenase-like lactoylglutathione lyase family enzyme